MHIRSATPHDLDFFDECVRNEGWLSETRFVFEGFLTRDPAGCFVAESDGRRAGMCVATAYGRCGFLGELIVIPSHRSRGLGTLLMKHAIAYLQSTGCATVYLDGDLPAVPIYERLGFRPLTRSLRFLGRIEPERADVIVPITPDGFESLLRIDLEAFGADRRFFLERRFRAHGELCFMHMDRGIPVGFILGQPGHGVITVGPWLNTSDGIDPLALLRALATTSPDMKLRVGVLESNRTASGLMRSLPSFIETEPSIRMALGPDCALGASDRLFAVGAPSKG